MRKVFIGVLFLTLIFVFVNSSYAEKKKSDESSLSIGIVDVDIITKQMPEALDADKNLKDLQKRYNDSLTMMQDDYIKKVEKYQKQKNMMPADQQQKQEEGFKMQEQMILKYREDKYNEINQRREEFLDPIRQKIKKAIQEVSKEEGITFVFEKNSSAVLYFDDKFEITFKVLDKIKRGTK